MLHANLKFSAASEQYIQEWPFS